RMRSMGWALPADDGGTPGRRGLIGATYVRALNEKPDSHASPSSIQERRTRTSFSVSRAPSGGIRSSGASLVTRLMSLLWADFPGTAAFFTTSASVSSDIEPL